MAPNKNIVLLVADDLGREQLSCYGCRALQTANLDRLAASGSRFDMAFASTASCSGSRTTLYTGLHTHENGSYGLTGGRSGFRTFDNVETAPKVFNDIGYRTAILGKLHVAPRGMYPWQVQRESDTRNSAEIADQAEEFFQQCIAEDQSFFLTIGYVDPHRVMGSRGGFGNKEGNYDSRLNDRVFNPEEIAVPSFMQDLPEMRQELVEYYRAINRLDQGVGLLLDAIDRQGLADDTLVLFLSDNGPPFINSKTTLYDAGVRLPFIMRVPGRAAGIVNESLVSYLDVLPTLLDWAGHSGRQAPQGFTARRGKSFLPIVDQAQQQYGWDRVFGSHTFHEVTNFYPVRYMRTSQYKYHRNVCWKLDFPMAADLYASLSFEAARKSAEGDQPAMIGKRSLAKYICRPPEELYDLVSDPEEVVNLAGNPKFQETLESMRASLEKWQDETGDLWLWRDGIAVHTLRHWGYEREGLKVPDRFDYDAKDPAGKTVEVYSVGAERGCLIE